MGGEDEEDGVLFNTRYSVNISHWLRGGLNVKVGQQALTSVKLRLAYMVPAELIPCLGKTGESCLQLLLLTLRHATSSSPSAHG